ncbi:MAG TPA: polynucleotide adenylyltransferase PcnB [Burkholderiales bacterium]|nr:polynucleotide adenylyltransferase PcnB [Betaproteobacteria bacterium]HQR51947.1 polynucleotide adenylyltransferase PcnB [Burkholderiales bacterium]
MIRKFLHRVFSRRARSQDPVVIPFETHGVARSRISDCARKVTSTLQERGFKAFVVGGAVRDLLLGRDPKDFDVATDATPEEVRSAFRRSRIIGRRFQIVHCLCGAETIEVSTFRGPSGEAGNAAPKDAHGRLLRDNVWGTQEEDALRRDFTVNALFYDPTTQEIVDYCGGWGDLQKRLLRIIGDPEQRYREDPVRMLRAVRLAAKLELELEPATRRPIKPLADLLENVPAARLFDEMLKLLLSGHAAESVSRLREEGLHHGLLPMLDVIVEQPLGQRFVLLALRNTDQRICADKPVSPAFLFAALLWHEVLSAWKTLQASGMKPIPALHDAMEQVVSQQSEKLAIPRRLAAPMKELWAMQPRFEARSGRRPHALLAHERFRAGYDFLLLRCESGEVDAELGDWWTRFQDASDEERGSMLLPNTGKGTRRRRPRRKRPAVVAETVGGGGES